MSWLDSHRDVVAKDGGYVPRPREQKPQVRKQRRGAPMNYRNRSKEQNDAARANLAALGILNADGSFKF